MPLPADLRIRDYKFVEPTWCPDVVDPPLQWSRLDQGTPASPGRLLEPKSMEGWPEGPEGPTTQLHSSVYDHYKLWIENHSLRAQLAVFQYRYSRPGEDPGNDEEFSRLIRNANKAAQETWSERRTQLVCVEVR